MTNQSTIDKLIEMRLTSMSDAFITQMDDPKMKDVPFEDRFGLLVDIEYNNRKSNSLKRLIKGAGFDQPEAYIADINYTSGRKLNRNLIERLATCEYITEHRNLFITGATGSGKTYMACAFGMEACKQRYKTKYVRLPDMLLELDLARTDGSYKKVQAKYANPILLIIDEWLLLKPNMISWNCFTDEEKNPPRFSARITIPVAGMTSSAAMTAPWQKLFLTASNTMPTRSTSFRLILTTTVP